MINILQYCDVDGVQQAVSDDAIAKIRLHFAYLKPQSGPSDHRGQIGFSGTCTLQRIMYDCC